MTDQKFFEITKNLEKLKVSVTRGLAEAQSQIEDLREDLKNKNEHEKLEDLENNLKNMLVCITGMEFFLRISWRTSTHFLKSFTTKKSRS